MMTIRRVRGAAGAVAGAAAVAALGYAAFAGSAYMRFGHATRARTKDEEDPRLDELMPRYDIVERHHVRVAAPADVTLGVARDLNVLDSPVARAIFKGREVMLGATPSPREVAEPAGLVSTALRLGWGVLSDEAGHEIVLGAVTRPWEGNPTFRDLLPRDFLAFTDPGFVKIAWTLRADPVSGGGCIFRTETRAVATDMHARAKFRRYWALVSPGVALIRRSMLDPVKREAERRAALATLATIGPAVVPSI